MTDDSVCGIKISLLLVQIFDMAEAICETSGFLWPVDDISSFT